jgi:hypothetical protein
VDVRFRRAVVELITRVLAGVVAARVPVENEGANTRAASAGLLSPAIVSDGLRPKLKLVLVMKGKEPPDSSRGS